MNLHILLVLALAGVLFLMLVNHFWNHLKTLELEEHKMRTTTMKTSQNLDQIKLIRRPSMPALLPKDLLADLESEDRTELHLKGAIAPRTISVLARAMGTANNPVINQLAGGAMSGGLLGISAQEQSAFSSLSGLANQQHSAFSANSKTFNQMLREGL